MPISEDQVRVYDGLTTIFLKIVFAICILIAFFIILNFVIAATSWQDRAIFGALDAILAGTMYPVTSHLFPAIKKAREIENRNK